MNKHQKTTNQTSVTNKLGLTELQNRLENLNLSEKRKGSDETILTSNGQNESTKLSTSSVTNLKIPNVISRIETIHTPNTTSENLMETKNDNENEVVKGISTDVNDNYNTKSETSSKDSKDNENNNSLSSDSSTTSSSSNSSVASSSSNSSTSSSSSSSSSSTFKKSRSRKKK